MQALSLRTFAPSDADYTAVVELRNAAMPDYRDAVEDWRHWDETRPACEARIVVRRRARKVHRFHSHDVGEQRTIRERGRPDGRVRQRHEIGPVA